MTERDAYTNPIYLATRRAWVTKVRHGEAQCSAPECLHERDNSSRDIHPDADVHVIRDTTGQIVGVAHYRCLQSMRAKKVNKARKERFLKL